MDYPLFLGAIDPSRSVSQFSLFLVLTSQSA